MVLGVGGASHGPGVGGASLGTGAGGAATVLGALADGVHPVIRGSRFWLFTCLSVRARAHSAASPQPSTGPWEGS